MFVRWQTRTRRARAFGRDPNTDTHWAAILAERAMLWGLGGGCLVPIGSLTKVDDHLLTLRGAVLSPDGSRRIVDTHCGPSEKPLNVGAELAARLLSAGARELLDGLNRTG